MLLQKLRDFRAVQIIDANIHGVTAPQLAGQALFDFRKLEDAATIHGVIGKFFSDSLINDKPVVHGLPCKRVSGHF